MRMARSMAYALAVVLIERVPSVAARGSAPTWSTPGRPCRKVRSAARIVSSETSADVVTPSCRESMPDRVYAARRDASV